MANNSHLYFLSVDDRIIDFSNLGFPNMTSFLTLSLFTGLFANEEELLTALSSLKLIDEDETSSFVSIVKRRGSVPREHYYTQVTSDILYKRDASFLDAGCIERFLFDNRNKHYALKPFFERYLQSTEGLIEYFKNKVKDLELSVHMCTGKQKRETSKELESRQNSLFNFLQYKSNIHALLHALTVLSTENYVFDRELESEYISRLSSFVRGETYYINRDKTTPNYRGLVKIAIMVGSLLNEYPELARPSKTNKFSQEKIKLLKAFQAAVEKAKMPPRSNHTNSEEEETLEPDEFMFLEDHDYDRMIDAAKEEAKDDIREQKQILLEKKEKYRKP